MKYVAEVSPSNVDKKIKEDESEVLLCNYVDVYKNEFITKGLRFMKATASDSQIEKFALSQGDVLLTKDSEDPADIANPALVRERLENVICGYHLTHVKPGEKLFGSFLFRIFQSKRINSYFEVSAKGVTRYGLGTEVFLNFLLVLPPLPEQTTIAHFLDHKTAQIDAAIDKHRQLIALLQEHRAALINEAVTKGINPDAPMKDSGIEWIGAVPAHWEVKKLKWVHKTTSGGTPNTGKPEYYDGEIPWLRTLDLNSNILLDYEVTITDMGLANSSAKMVPINSVLVAMYGGAGTIGKSGLLKFKSTINQAICAILPSENTIPEYLHFFIIFYRPFWMIGAEGTRRDPNISQTDIRNMYFYMPPLPEQQQIVDFIESETTRIDREINLAQQEINLLEEYRQSLIAEAVTGKIDVRNYVLED